MRARLDVDDMVALRRGRLTFQPVEVASMRASTMWEGVLAASGDRGPDRR